jgi:hypothetical protein
MIDKYPNFLKFLETSLTGGFAVWRRKKTRIKLRFSGKKKLVGPPGFEPLRMKMTKTVKKFV